MTQKFKKGDLVHVAANLGVSMRHFTNDIDAIVLGSYKDQYGTSNTKDYTLHLKGQGECSWYHESQLTLLEANRPDLLAQWEVDKKAEIKQASDIDWIFSQEYNDESNLNGASVERLARDLGCKNMWGSSGEGFVWYENAIATLSHARPFLKNKDKAGWLKYAAEYSTAQKES